MRPLCIGRKNTFHRLINEAECYALLRETRWHGGAVHCPFCGSTDVSGPWSVPWVRDCHRYYCYGCRRRFSDRTGTVFEMAKLPLSAWFLIIYLAELGKTILEISREVPCRYDTAHRIVWLIREREISLEQGRKLSGIIEIDEIYQTAGHKGQAKGGGSQNLSRPPRRRGKKQGPGRGSAQKDSPVIEGMVSRDGQTVIEVADDVTRQTLEPIFEKRVKKGSAIYSDTASCYNFLEEAGYHHETVNHSKREYVRGDVHENRPESLWMLWLLFILPFRGVAQSNLPKYAKVLQFRRIHRNLNAYERVTLVVNSIVEKAQEQILKILSYFSPALENPYVIYHI